MLAVNVTLPPEQKVVVPVVLMDAAGPAPTVTVDAAEVTAEGLPYVIIDLDPDKVARVHEAGGLAVLGDAALESKLKEAGIESVLLGAGDRDMMKWHMVKVAELRDTWRSVVDQALDGFPVVRDWDDPIQYSCQKNFVLGIGDIYTHADKNVPGSTGTTNEPAKPASIVADTAVNAQTATNLAFALQGLSAPNPDNYSGRYNSAAMVGLAYWANVNDIRPDVAGVAKTQGKQTIQTLWVDVLEQPFVTNNQFYLTAKYGGFKDVTESGNPFKKLAPGTALWVGADGKLRHETWWQLPAALDGPLHRAQLGHHAAAHIGPLQRLLHERRRRADRRRLPARPEPLRRQVRRPARDRDHERRPAPDLALDRETPREILRATVLQVENHVPAFLRRQES